MNRIKLPMIFLVVVAIFATVVVHATSDKQVRPNPVAPKAVSEIKVQPASIPEKSTPRSYLPGYEMVTDVLDAFGGASSSTNYKIPVNSGGQPSAIGISASTNYKVKAGYVYSSYVYHGDANANGVIDLGDIVYLITYLYKSGPAPLPLEAGDVNCSGIVELGDVVYLIAYLFKGGPPPRC